MTFTGTNKMDVREVIIIGSGPAGLTAAIYAGRAGLKPLVFTGYMYGGQLMFTTLVENFPGFPDGVDGPRLMENMKTQAAKFGAELKHVDATAVDFKKRPFEVAAGKEKFAAKSVIIATGATARRLGVPGESKLFGRGVSSCATCDGALYKGKTVAVVGGGDSAMEEALFLTRFASRVVIIHRRGELRASKIMRESAAANPKIKFAWFSTVAEVLSDGTRVTGVRLKDVRTSEMRDVPIDGLFLAIGHVPLTKFFKGQVDMDEEGYIIAHDGATRTSVEGVFVCGDVRDTRYRQAITAAANGCQAAIDCEKYLREMS
jgi:thioredoxin reductase (NADPH)